MKEKLNMKAAEQSDTAQQSCQKKLSYLLSQSPMTCFEVTLTGTILFISPSIETISGYSHKELVNRSMWNLYADMSAREQLIEKLYQEGQLVDYRVFLKDKDDRVRACRIDAILLCADSGEPKTLFGTFLPLD
jgi:PAS domain S-box-containing protein